jgi:hypothetical protein
MRYAITKESYAYLHYFVWPKPHKFQLILEAPHTWEFFDGKLGLSNLKATHAACASAEPVEKQLYRQEIAQIAVRLHVITFCSERGQILYFRKGMYKCSTFSMQWIAITYTLRKWTDNLAAAVATESESWDMDASTVSPSCTHAAELELRFFTSAWSTTSLFYKSRCVCIHRLQYAFEKLLHCPCSRIRNRTLKKSST